MLRRIFHSSMMLAVLLAAYQAYVLLAVPWMEPPFAIKEARRATRAELDRAAQAVTKYQLLLSNYFSKDHWSQKQPPKVIASSNEQAMLVLDDYTRHEGGRVDIAKFALLVFPTPPREGITPPRDAIILEAPQGARLQFDDFRPERGQIGQITRGQFPGRITIRSDMNEPGQEDNLLVETSDLEMNTKLLYTNSPVCFRLGENVGRGRELEIRFLVDEHLQPDDAGLKISGIDSLEIRRDVKFRLQLETESLLPGELSPEASVQGSGSEEPKPPVEVTCSGPFTFDFVRYVASLDRDVDLRQLNPDGPSDQLLCKQLDIHFAPKPLPGGAAEPILVDPAKRQQRDLGRLEPAAIIAEGHPVVVISPSRRAQARGDRIQIALRQRRVRISGGRDAMLVYGPNVLRAPTIEYQHPPREAATTIGHFRATGPGSLHYVLDPAEPEQFFQAVWQTSVELDREKGQPVLTLEGRPQLAFADAGSLTADRLKLYLRELESQAAGTGLEIAGGQDGRSKLQVTPDRLLATGRVEIHSAQLTGRTGLLTATFRLQPEAAANVAADSGTGPATGPLNFAPDGDRQQSFHIDTDKMQVEIHLNGGSAAPATISCDGNVVLREVPLVPSSDQPLEIRAAQLIVDRLDSSAPYVTLRGQGAAAEGDGAGRASSGSQLAQISGRGVTLLTDVVELDARENRLWSNGPGKATLLVTRDLDGGDASGPFPVDITWQGGLAFDGRTVEVSRGVLLSSTDDTLRCDRLSARVSAPIEFTAGIDQQAIELAEVECLGQVAIEYLSRDAVGLTSQERAHLARLTIDQRTGVVTGDGPGVIRSTRFGDGLAALDGGQDGAQQLAAPAQNAAGSKLHFLWLEFRGDLEGNLYTRELTFRQQVRAVYGPVDSWEQELDLTRPETLPPDAVTLACDEMRVNEDPVAARSQAVPGGKDSGRLGPVQLQATGNVQIDGHIPGQGAFTAQAHRASYEGAQEVFLLKGDGRTPAKLWRPGQRGAPPAVDWIRYARNTGEITVGGVQYLEITPADLENARRPAPVR